MTLTGKTRGQAGLGEGRSHTPGFLAEQAVGRLCQALGLALRGGMDLPRDPHPMPPAPLGRQGWIPTAVPQQSSGARTKYFFLVRPHPGARPTFRDRVIGPFVQIYLGLLGPQGCRPQLAAFS